MSNQERYTSEQIRAMVSKGQIIPSRRGFDLGKGKKKKKEPRIPNPKKPNKKRKPAYVISMEDVYAQILYWKERGGVFIPYQVISLKNSKAIYPYIKDGEAKFSVQPSKPYLQYQGLSVAFYSDGKILFDQMIKKAEAKTPYFIGMYFIRLTRALFDYQNMTQGPLDLMEAAKWYLKDDTKNVVPVIMGHGLADPVPGIVMFLLDQPSYWMGQPPMLERTKAQKANDRKLSLYKKRKERWEIFNHGKDYDKRVLRDGEEKIQL